MRIPKIKLGFSSMGDKIFDSEATGILKAMTGNKSFPSPIPSIADLKTLVQTYSGALADAKSGDKTKIALKDTARNALEIALTVLSHYVSLVAQFDKSMYASAGFKLVSESSTNRDLGLVSNFTVTMGQNSGEAVLSVDPLPLGRAYIFLYAPIGTPPDLWMLVIGTSSSITIPKLNPLTQYIFRVAIAGPRSLVAFSEIITKTVV